MTIGLAGLFGGKLLWCKFLRGKGHLFLSPPSWIVIIGCVTVLGQACMIVVVDATAIAGNVAAEKTVAAFTGCMLFRNRRGTLMMAFVVMSCGIFVGRVQAAFPKCVSTRLVDLAVALIIVVELCLESTAVVMEIITLVITAIVAT